jgi:hypothetical protein
MSGTCREASLNDTKSLDGCASLQDGYPLSLAKTLQTLVAEATGSSCVPSTKCSDDFK